jgi:pimeloyl-ACP methyl ester carboxylesterase
MILEVPDARLYYEVRGSGPILLTIPGGPADAGIFSGLAACLADRYTVVAYDPRGNSRSLFDGVPVEQSLDVHGDDAARLLASLGEAPAYVFGSSGGAQIGLNLAARHPARVHTLVAHEPPCIRLLADAPAVLARTQAVYDTYRRDGAGAAMQAFMALAGMGAGQPTAGSPPPPEVLETFARINENVDYFLKHGILPISSYAPDVDALRAGSPRVVAGVGETSQGQLAHRTALALAAALGTKPVTFPGDHGGYGPHASAFAETLHGVLRER